MHNFTHKEDRQYFIDLLADGDTNLFEEKFFQLFDFRDPIVKRKEFNAIRDNSYTELTKNETKCQFKVHPDCSKENSFEVDHVIPLSSAYLQRKLRGIKNNPDGTKPTSLSYGSNHKDNLILACKRCNAFKKHRIMLPK